MKQNYDFFASLVAVGTASFVITPYNQVMAANESVATQDVHAAGGVSVRVRVPKEVAELRQRSEREQLLNAFSLIGETREPAGDDWKSSIGMFAGHTDMMQISEEARKVRNSHVLD